MSEEKNDEAKLVVEIREQDIKDRIISDCFGYEVREKIGEALKGRDPLGGNGIDNILAKIVEEKLREIVDDIDMEAIKEKALGVFETKFRTMAKKMIDSIREKDNGEHTA